MLDMLIRGQRDGKSQSEIAEGIRAGFGSDYLSLDEGLAKGSTIVGYALPGARSVPEAWRFLYLQPLEVMSFRALFH